MPGTVANVAANMMRLHLTFDSQAITTTRASSSRNPPG